MVAEYAVVDAVVAVGVVSDVMDDAAASGGVAAVVMDGVGGGGAGCAVVIAAGPACWLLPVACRVMVGARYVLVRVSR